MNQLAERQSSEVAASGSNTGSNPYVEYGNTVNQRTIVGNLLKFSKGDWTYGEQNEELPAGKKLIANMEELLVGWVRWEDNKPTDQIMGRVVDRFKAPKRGELGDDDKEKWELDTATHQPRDPWQLTNYLVLMDPDDKEDLYTFATASRGGLNAIGALCKEYGQKGRTKPDQFPIVELGVDSYNHPNKQFGRIKVPTLEIVGWAPKDVFADAVDEAKRPGENDETPF
jgi:hypothetical protein